MSVNQRPTNRTSFVEADKHDHDHDDSDDDDHEEQIQSQIWTYTVFVASIPLLYLGNYFAAGCFICIGIVYMYFGEAVTTNPNHVSIVDQYRTQYSLYSVDDIVLDLNKWHTKHKNRTQVKRDDVNISNRGDKVYHEMVLMALSAMAKKIGIMQEQHKNAPRDVSTKRVSHPTADDSCTNDNKIDMENELTQAVLLCQDAVYTCIQSCDNMHDDSIVASSLALLALVSKHDAIRQRYIRSFTDTLDCHTYCNIDIIIKCVDMALIRGKEYKNESEERFAAELQRKACLLLGAVSDGNESIAMQIGQRGGIQTILNAMAWYRYHTDVANWGLWSIFTLCCENSVNKIILIQLDGIPIVIQTMKNCSDSNDVARHGTAILFDILRENSTNFVSSGNSTTTSTNIPSLDVWKIRDISLSAGLLDCILHVMKNFSDSTNLDVHMMGRAILAGVNYKGSIPEPQLAIVSSSNEN
jgi:hypothetical protein